MIRDYGAVSLTGGLVIMSFKGSDRETEGDNWTGTASERTGASQLMRYCQLNMRTS